nr:Ufm1-conjugating enzyme 1 [Schistosoma japonicum]
MVDETTKKTLASIPLLKTRAGPLDGDMWIQRLKEEYQALIKYVENNKLADNDWFRIESNQSGTRWYGKC